MINKLYLYEYYCKLQCNIVKNNNENKYVSTGLLIKDPLKLLKDIEKPIEKVGY